MFVIDGKFRNVLWIDDDGRIKWKTHQTMEPLDFSIEIFRGMVQIMESGGPNPHGQEFIVHSRQILVWHDIYFGDDLV